MSMYVVEGRCAHIGRYRIPFLPIEIMKPLDPGDKFTLGEQEATVIDRDRIRVDSQEINLREQKGSRFPEEGNQFVALRHVRCI